MAKETVLYSGVWTETCDTRGKKTIDSVAVKVLLENGYPVIGNTCNQPNICDLLTDCDLSGMICATNGLSLSGEPLCVRLGGELTGTTEIDTAAFDFSVTKDNVSLDINTSGGGLGVGEVARFIGIGGTVTAQIGVYTNNAGTPTVVSHTLDTSTSFYTRLRQATTLNQFILDAGVSTNAYSSYVSLVFDGISLGLTGSSDTNVTVKKAAFTGGTDVIQLNNLPVFANEAAALAALLPTNSVYQTVTGELRIKL